MWAIPRHVLAALEVAIGRSAVNLMLSPPRAACGGREGGRGYPRWVVHSQPQNVRGVDLVTGASYVGTGLTRDTFVALPSGGVILIFVNEFHIQATAGADSFLVNQLFHVTVTGNGTVTAVVGNVFTSC